MLGYEPKTLASTLVDEALMPFDGNLKLGKPAILFTKLEDKKIAEMEKILNSAWTLPKQRCPGRKSKKRLPAHLDRRLREDGITRR